MKRGARLLKRSRRVFITLPPAATDRTRLVTIRRCRRRPSRRVFSTPRAPTPATPCADPRGAASSVARADSSTAHPTTRGYPTRDASFADPTPRRS
eukprot:2929-Pelagococcus_subviridis.AAC.2